MGSFTKAERKKLFIKLGISGPSGSGKTYSALRLARGLVGDKGRIAFIDTENGSATLYDSLTDFDHCEIKPNANGKFHYQDFIDKIQEAERLGYDAVIIDSASHLWQGILADKESLDINSKGGNSYTNWAQPTKNFNATIQKFLQSRIHLISCMRSKMDYVLEENDKGKKVPKKVGLAPQMRDGIEYEFTIVFDVLANHQSNASKDRTGLFVNAGNFLITEETGRQIADWLASGKGELPPPEPTPSEPVTPPPAPPTAPAASTPPAPTATVPPAAPPAAPPVSQQNNRDAERKYLKQLVDEGIVAIHEIQAIAQRYTVSKVTDLTEEKFQAFMANVRLYETIVRDAVERKVPREKLDEFARANGGSSLFDSTLETKQQIQSLIQEQTTPKQG